MLRTKIDENVRAGMGSSPLNLLKNQRFSDDFRGIEVSYSLKFA